MMENHVNGLYANNINSINSINLHYLNPTNNQNIQNNTNNITPFNNKIQINKHIINHKYPKNLMKLIDPIKNDILLSEKEHTKLRERKKINYFEGDDDMEPNKNEEKTDMPSNPIPKNSALSYLKNGTIFSDSSSIPFQNNFFFNNNINSNINSNINININQINSNSNYCQNTIANKSHDSLSSDLSDSSYNNKTYKHLSKKEKLRKKKRALKKLKIQKKNKKVIKFKTKKILREKKLYSLDNDTISDSDSEISYAYSDSDESIKDIENEYSENFYEAENEARLRKAKKETIETINKADKLIAKLENQYLNIKLNKDKTTYLYPENCIPINADLLKFDFDKLIQKQVELTQHKFDVIMMDPPWKIFASNPSRGVKISYNTLNDRNIESLPIQKLSDDGFIFIWSINAKYRFTLSLMNKWGYKYVDEIIWVKQTINGKIAKGNGFYLQHAKESCLVGIKGNPKYTKDINNYDVIFSQRRAQSQKPIEIYEKIEKLVPNGYYLELFGRRNNLRDFWVTIGNEI